MASIKPEIIAEEELVSFAQSRNDEFYQEALDDYQRANEVVKLAKEERARAVHKLAMLVKLKDSEDYARESLNQKEYENLTLQEKLSRNIKNGRYRYGQSKAAYGG